MIEKIKTHLKDQVKDVVISDRLTDSAVCLVSGKFDMSSHMQKILSQMGQNESLPSQRIMEINPNHKLFETMIMLLEMI